MSRGDFKEFQSFVIKSIFLKWRYLAVTHIYRGSALLLLMSPVSTIQFHYGGRENINISLGPGVGKYSTLVWDQFFSGLIIFKHLLHTYTDTPIYTKWTSLLCN